MGYYAEKREEFKKRFGFYPSKESGLLDLFVHEKDEQLLLKLSEQFFNYEKNANYIKKLEEEFYSSFNRNPLRKEELFEFHIFKKNDDYVFNYVCNLIRRENDFSGDLHLFGYFGDDVNKQEIIALMNPNISKRLSKGDYNNGLEKAIFKIDGDALLKMNYYSSCLLDKGIRLPTVSDGILLKSIGPGCFKEAHYTIQSKYGRYSIESENNMFISIPNNYTDFDPKAFCFNWLGYDKDCPKKEKDSFCCHCYDKMKNVDLDDYNVINVNNYMAFAFTNVEDRLLNEFYEMTGLDSLNYYSRLFREWIRDKDKFTYKIELLKRFMMGETLNASDMDMMSSLLGYEENEYSELRYIIEPMGLKEIHLPYSIHNDHMLKESQIVNLCLNDDVIFHVSNWFTFEDYLFSKYPDRFVVEKPYDNIENKIVGYCQSMYYEKYRDKYLLNHSLEEWKIFVAPSRIKELVRNDPKVNKHILIDKHYSRNDGVSNVWYYDEDEYYWWDDNYKCWLYYYSND